MEVDKSETSLPEKPGTGSNKVTSYVGGEIVKLTPSVGNKETTVELDATMVGIPDHVKLNDFYDKNFFISDQGICIRMDINNPEFDLANFQLQLRVCIDSIYRNGVYFHRLDRKAFESALFGTKDEIKASIDPNSRGVLFCSTIGQIAESQIKFFEKIYGGKVQISNDTMKATLVPSTLLYLRQMLGEGYMENDISILKSDLFHAYFWLQGIKYYGGSNFLERVDGKGRDMLEDILKEVSGIVAIGKKSTETRDDMRVDYEVIENLQKKNPNIKNPFPSWQVRKRPLIVDGKAVIGEMESFFPKATKDQCVFEIILGKRGDPGILVSGKPVLCKDIKKISLASQLDVDPELIDVVISDPTRTGVVAKEDVYISESHGRLGFSRHKKYVGEIGKKTGNINLPKDGTTFELVGDIGEGYSVNGYDIIYSGNLYGKISAQNTVNIKSGGIIGGYVIAGNEVLIERGVKIHDKTKIEATNGTVLIDGDLNGATITADKIIIRGVAKNCTLIARRVEIGTNNGSKIMAESFHINNDMSGNAEYTVLVYAGIHTMIHELSELQKDIEGKTEDEKTQIGKISEQLNGEDVLVGGFIHPESRFQIMAVPFLMNTDLGVLMQSNNHPELIRSKKSYGLLNTVFLAQRKEGVLCNISKAGLNRNQATGILENKLQNRLVIRESPRDPLYKRGIRLPIVLGALKGFIFDYSDTGCSFAFESTQPIDGGNISVNTTTDVTILDNKAVSFFITRIETNRIGGMNYLRVSGSYISYGIGAKISQVVAFKETEGKRKQQ